MRLFRPDRHEHEALCDLIKQIERERKKEDVFHVDLVVVVLSFRAEQSEADMTVPSRAVIR